MLARDQPKEYSIRNLKVPQIGAVLPETLTPIYVRGGFALLQDLPCAVKRTTDCLLPHSSPHTHLTAGEDAKLYAAAAAACFILFLLKKIN